MAGTGFTLFILLVPLGLFLAYVTGFPQRSFSFLIPTSLALVFVAGMALLRARARNMVGRVRLLLDLDGVMARATVSSDRLSAFMDLAPQLALETDAQGSIVYLDGNLCERWRVVGKETTAGHRSSYYSAHPLVAPDSTVAFASFTKEVLSGEQPDELRMNLRPDSGPDIPVRVRGRAILGPDGRTVVGMRAVFTDISSEVEVSTTGRAEIERHLREGNRKLMDIIEFLPDPTFVIDEQREVVAWNRALEELTGVPKAEMIGQGDHAYAVPFCGERVPVLIDHFQDADLGEYRQMYNFVEVNGDTLYAESFIPFLNEGRGAYLWVTASPLYNSEGKVVGAIESLRDITYRKRAEEALRHSEEQYRKLNEDLERRVAEGTRELRVANSALLDSEARYRRIIENLGGGHIFYSQDTDGNFSYVSPSFSEVLGYGDQDTFVSRFRVWQRLPQNSKARIFADKSRLGFKQPPYDLEVFHQDGSIRVLEILEVPVFGQDGKVESVEGLGRDVTEDRRNLELIREAQNQLMESEKMAALGTLVAGLSHEINTPVGIGVTAVSHLSLETHRCLTSYREKQLTRSAFEEFLESSSQTIELVQSNLNRAADLLQNFKQVATDQSSGQVRAFELDEYLDDVIMSLSPRLRNTGFQIRKECQPGLKMNCDPSALYQIISNLIMNSLDHAFDGMLVGEILLKARPEGGNIILEYADNGNGMTRAQLARLYEPFYTTKRGRGGTGLGMHIVYNNVTQVLAGNISCTSRPGRGTRFVITIPLLAEVGHA